MGICLETHSFRFEVCNCQILSQNVDLHHFLLPPTPRPTLDNSSVSLTMQLFVLMYIHPYHPVHKKSDTVLVFCFASLPFIQPKRSLPFLS